VSVANFTDYQSRMLEAKYRTGQTVRHAHMLNGTLIAIQRGITCLLEHFYSPADHVIKIPAVLQPYLRTDALKPTKIQ
jgi:seryl-tRNA synthetase